jgi:hypothetical protein
MALIHAPRFQITSTPTVLNADAYDANDVIVDTTAITHNMFNLGGTFKLEQIEFWDQADQAAAALTFVFLNSNVTYGTKDAAPSITDANGIAYLTGIYVGASAAILDQTDFKYGLWNPNIFVTPATSTASPLSVGTLYYAIASAGTPTYATGCLQLRFTFSAA